MKPMMQRKTNYLNGIVAQVFRFATYETHEEEKR